MSALKSVHRTLGVFFAVLLLGVVVNGSAMARSDGLAFSVLRDGSPFGTHEISFRQDGEDLHVEVAIDLEVSLGFITLFRYEHRNHEIWRDGRLVSIETRTDDDGERYSVSGRATGKGFLVTGAEGEILMPSDVLPTSYWHPETVQRDRMLDTQRGRLIEVRVQPIGLERVGGADGQTATRYRVSGDLTLDLWYDARGEWRKLSFAARGSDITYARSTVVRDAVKPSKPQSAIAR